MLELPNGLATGVRTASDFLMALQLTGAAKTNSVANMQLRLPVVVVGGGLTAIDTATEALAYYPVQVEKILSRYEALVADAGRDAVESAWTAEERSIAGEFLAHARALRDERAAAAREGREARIVELLQGWGGATIAYRRRLVDSPSYTLNHEEVEKALEEGIRFAEGLTPLAVEVDAHGHACALRVSQHHNDGDGVWHEFGHASLPARAILVAAGHAAQHRARARRRRALPARRQVFPVAERGGPAGTPGQRPRQAGAAGGAHRHSRRRPRDQLLRRPASIVPRQRREGDGQCQAGLPDRVTHAGQGGAGVGRGRCGVSSID